MAKHKKVTAAKWVSVARIVRGKVAGSKVRWDLTLECGHEAIRYGGGDLKKPQRARCLACERMESRPGPARLVRRFL